MHAPRRLSMICLLATLPLVCAPARKARPTQPAVSAKMRAAAASRVTKQLDAKPADPIERAGALVPFFQFLSRTTEALHILHFGDSHTAADMWTGELRTSFQKDFGDGGAGFSLPGRPFPGYRRFDLRSGASPRWQTEGLRGIEGDGLLGLGGVSISTAYMGQSVTLQADCGYLEVFYLQQPGGGRIALYQDGEMVQEASTDGELAPGFLTYPTTSGPHHFELRTLENAPVRLFGWVTEKAQGVTYESMGLNGAEAAWILRWNEAMLASYIGRRNPALIVLAYGTNEAGDPQWTQESYRDMFSELLGRLRRAAPLASILVVGPPDRLYRYRGRLGTLPKLDVIIDAQKEACRLNGCAFWDTRARMGGKGSMRDWVQAGLAQFDYVHFNGAGYTRLAAALYQDILQEFEVFRQENIAWTNKQESSASSGP